nr:hypothetical protein [Leptospira noguchii]
MELRVSLLETQCIAPYESLSMDRVGNSAERSLWIALETQQNALYGSRWKLSRTLSMDRVGNSAERSLWIALETQQNALYGSRSRSFENS